MNFKKLGDYAKVQGGYAYKSNDFKENGIPVIKIKNVGKGNLLYNETSYVDDSFLNTTANYATKTGDVLISMTGSNINQPASMVGRVARVSKDDPMSLINQRVGRIVLHKENIIDIRFLYYYLSQYETQYYLVSNATGSANQVNINGKLIESINIPDFEFEDTKKIAHILSTLDDKIELNRKMNQTLEEMAQAIFKSWFVDFDPVHAKMACGNENELQQVAKKLGISKEILDLFPNEFEESELGTIPKGWEVVGFKDLVTKHIDNRGKTPPIESEGIPLLEVRTLPSDMLVKGHKTDKFVSEETYKTWFRSHLEPDDILISTVGTIGLTCIVPKDSRFTIAQNVLGIRANEKILLKKYMYYMMKSTSFINAINARLVTTVQSSIKRKDMETIDMIIPPLEIQEKFVQIIEPMMFTMQSNQNNTLQKTRDTLLSKLLSGEIDVSELEVRM